jgi:hypothetical protein
MRIYEEYLKRHQIDDVPMAHHAGQSCFFFTSNNRQFWCELLNIDGLFYTPAGGIIQFKWIGNDHHPGSYDVTMHYQIHDGHKHDKIFANYTIATIKWHEYENFVFSFTQKFKNAQIIKEENNIINALWEMFVASYDGWFYKQNGDIKYLLFQSLDDEQSKDTRIMYIQEIMKKISYSSPNILRNWKYEVLNRIQYRADWLADLIESHAKKILPCKD